jgi:hypothetical protein
VVNFNTSPVFNACSSAVVKGVVPYTPLTFLYTFICTHAPTTIHASCAGHVFVAAFPQESLQSVNVDAGVPQAVGQDEVQVIVPLGVQHAAVAAHDLVVALPHESVQVEIVDAAVPQAVGQSGEQVTVPFGVQFPAPQFDPFGKHPLLQHSSVPGSQSVAPHSIKSTAVLVQLPQKAFGFVP